MESVIERHVLFVSGYIDLIELWSFQAGSVEILPLFFWQYRLPWIPPEIILGVSNHEPNHDHSPDSVRRHLHTDDGFSEDQTLCCDRLGVNLHCPWRYRISFTRHFRQRILQRRRFNIFLRRRTGSRRNRLERTDDDSRHNGNRLSFHRIKNAAAHVGHFDFQNAERQMGDRLSFAFRRYCFCFR